jgi:3-deoxy-D-manno-octulosonic acid kinase
LSGIVEQRSPFEGGAILTDGSASGNAALALLAAQPELEAPVASAVVKGRGGAFYLHVAGHRWVARPYRRGGLAALVTRDRYLWTGENNVRSFREWRMLAALRARGLPVPAPIAARYRRQGWYYRADLITEYLEDTEPLSALLERAPVSLSIWVEIGRTLRRLHDAGACHADLNAHNILVGQSGAVFVIDFDRGALRAPGVWRDSNLARLFRSLQKICASLPADRFGATEWDTLLAAYRSLPASPRTALAGPAESSDQGAG